MADQDCDKCKCKVPKKYKWIIAILIVLIIIIIGLWTLTNLGFNKLVRSMGILALTGYWHISDNKYLFVFNDRIQMIDITSTKVDTLLYLSNADIVITKATPEVCEFSVKTYTPDVNKLSINGEITFSVIPPLGTMRMRNIDSNLDLTMYNDPEMTMAILKK